ncbi:phosphotransferase family protein [Jongsikchunia kroppenstedtii]|uniref:phosphotransferase family protein n=1 Tax=Jongsikchunia kroppenstedtii TaxID=1121721 RepID=UPI00036AB61D|nr:phosphotransferase family protein [Jongsikchunia kroppenstedtii]
MTPDELSAALPAVLEPELGPVETLDLQAVTGGASRTTWAFAAQTAAGVRRLILRMGPADEQHSGMALEAAAISRAAAAGTPVPAIVVADESASALGDPYLICDYVPGESLAPRILRAVDATGGRELLRQCAAAVAAIHRSDPAGLDLAVMDPLADWYPQLEAMGVRNATFEWVHRWLAARRPDATPEVLVHGDFRMGNVIIDTGVPRLTAVLDWELVHRGDRYEDLAWFCIRAWRFGRPRSQGAGGLGSVEDFVADYEEAAGVTIDRDVLRWWIVQSTLRWGIICCYQAHRHLSGRERSVELAAIGRRAAETEHDLLTLIEEAS